MESMGMTDTQFKAYIHGILEDIKEYRKLQKSESPELRAYAEERIEKLENRLQEALER